MNMIVLSLAVALSGVQMDFDRLPGNAVGPINCPEPPATIRTVDGRIYECRPEEGQDPYVDVTPPDERAHWNLPFGSIEPPPHGTGSYHPPADWPYRAIISHGNPAHNREYFYIFDRKGVVVDSNEPNAIGDQLTEIRVSGVRFWPTANVYYLMPSSNSGTRLAQIRSAGRLGDPGVYAYVVDGKMLCPALDESYIIDWPLPRADPSPSRQYINGHCADAYRIKSRFADDDVRNPRYYTYPGFMAGGLDLQWSFQRHDEPQRPVLNRKGQCVALCPQAGEVVGLQER